MSGRWSSHSPNRRPYTGHSPDQGRPGGRLQYPHRQPSAWRPQDKEYGRGGRHPADYYPTDHHRAPDYYRAPGYQRSPQDRDQWDKYHERYSTGHTYSRDEPYYRRDLEQSDRHRQHSGDRPHSQYTYQGAQCRDRDEYSHSGHHRSHSDDRNNDIQTDYIASRDRYLDNHYNSERPEYRASRETRHRDRHADRDYESEHSSRQTTSDSSPRSYSRKTSKSPKQQSDILITSSASDTTKNTQQRNKYSRHQSTSKLRNVQCVPSLTIESELFSPASPSLSSASSESADERSATNKGRNLQTSTSSTNFNTLNNTDEVSKERKKPIKVHLENLIKDAVKRNEETLQQISQHINAVPADVKQPLETFEKALFPHNKALEKVALQLENDKTKTIIKKTSEINSVQSNSEPKRCKINPKEKVYCSNTNNIKSANVEREQEVSSDSVVRSLETYKCNVDEQMQNVQSPNSMSKLADSQQRYHGKENSVHVKRDDSVNLVVDKGKYNRSASLSENKSSKEKSSKERNETVIKLCKSASSEQKQSHQNHSNKQSSGHHKSSSKSSEKHSHKVKSKNNVQLVHHESHNEKHTSDTRAGLIKSHSKKSSSQKKSGRNELTNSDTHNSDKKVLPNLSKNTTQGESIHSKHSPDKHNIKSDGNDPFSLFLGSLQKPVQTKKLKTKSKLTGEDANESSSLSKPRRHSGEKSSDEKNPLSLAQDIKTTQSHSKHSQNTRSESDSDIYGKLDSLLNNHKPKHKTVPIHCEQNKEHHLDNERHDHKSAQLHISNTGKQNTIKKTKYPKLKGFVISNSESCSDSDTSEQSEIDGVSQQRQRWNGGQPSEGWLKNIKHLNGRTYFKGIEIHFPQVKITYKDLRNVRKYRKKIKKIKEYNDNMTSRSVLSTANDEEVQSGCKITEQEVATDSKLARKHNSDTQKGLLKDNATGTAIKSNITSIEEYPVDQIYMASKKIETERAGHKAFRKQKPTSERSPESHISTKHETVNKAESKQNSDKVQLKTIQRKTKTVSVDNVSTSVELKSKSEHSKLIEKDNSADNQTCDEPFSVDKVMDISNVKNKDALIKAKYKDNPGSRMMTSKPDSANKMNDFSKQKGSDSTMSAKATKMLIGHELTSKQDQAKKVNATKVKTQESKLFSKHNVSNKQGTCATMKHVSKEKKMTKTHKGKATEKVKSGVKSTSNRKIIATNIDDVPKGIDKIVNEIAVSENFTGFKSSTTLIGTQTQDIYDLSEADNVLLNNVSSNANIDYNNTTIDEIFGSLEETQPPEYMSDRGSTKSSEKRVSRVSSVEMKDKSHAQDVDNKSAGTEDCNISCVSESSSSSDILFPVFDIGTGRKEENQHTLISQLAKRKKSLSTSSDDLFESIGNKDIAETQNTQKTIKGYSKNGHKDTQHHPIDNVNNTKFPKVFLPLHSSIESEIETLEYALDSDCHGTKSQYESDNSIHEDLHSTTTKLRPFKRKKSLSSGSEDHFESLKNNNVIGTQNTQKRVRRFSIQQVDTSVRSSSHPHSTVNDRKVETASAALPCSIESETQTLEYALETDSTCTNSESLLDEGIQQGVNAAEHELHPLKRKTNMFSSSEEICKSSTHIDKRIRRHSSQHISKQPHTKPSVSMKVTNKSKHRKFSKRKASELKKEHHRAILTSYSSQQFISDQTGDEADIEDNDSSLLLGSVSETEDSIPAASSHSNSQTYDARINANELNDNDVDTTLQKQTSQVIQTTDEHQPAKPETQTDEQLKQHHGNIYSISELGTSRAEQVVTENYIKKLNESLLNMENECDKTDDATVITVQVKKENVGTINNNNDKEANEEQQNSSLTVNNEHIEVKEEPNWLKFGYTQEPDVIFLSDDDEMIMSVSQPVITIESDSDKELSNETQDPEYYDFFSSPEESDAESDFEVDTQYVKELQTKSGSDNVNEQLTQNWVDSIPTTAIKQDEQERKASEIEKSDFISDDDAVMSVDESALYKTDECKENDEQTMPDVRGNPDPQKQNKSEQSSLHLTKIQIYTYTPKPTVSDDDDGTISNNLSNLESMGNQHEHDDMPNSVSNCKTKEKKPVKVDFMSEDDTVMAVDESVMCSDRKANTGSNEHYITETKSDLDADKTSLNDIIETDSSDGSSDIMLLEGIGTEYENETQLDENTESDLNDDDKQIDLPLQQNFETDTELYTDSSYTDPQCNSYYIKSHNLNRRPRFAKRLGICFDNVFAEEEESASSPVVTNDSIQKNYDYIVSTQIDGNRAEYVTSDSSQLQSDNPHVNTSVIESEDIQDDYWAATQVDNCNVQQKLTGKQSLNYATMAQLDSNRVDRKQADISAYYQAATQYDVAENDSNDERNRTDIDVSDYMALTQVDSNKVKQKSARNTVEYLSATQYDVAENDSNHDRNRTDIDVSDYMALTQVDSNKFKQKSARNTMEYISATQYDVAESDSNDEMNIDVNDYMALTQVDSNRVKEISDIRTDYQAMTPYRATDARHADDMDTVSHSDVDDYMAMTQLDCSRSKRTMSDDEMNLRSSNRTEEQDVEVNSHDHYGLMTQKDLQDLDDAIESENEYDVLPLMGHKSSIKVNMLMVDENVAPNKLSKNRKDTHIDQHPSCLTSSTHVDDIIETDGLDLVFGTSNTVNYDPFTADTQLDMEDAFNDATENIDKSKAATFDKRSKPAGKNDDHAKSSSKNIADNTSKNKSSAIRKAIFIEPQRQKSTTDKRAAGLSSLHNTGVPYVKPKATSITKEQNKHVTASTTGSIFFPKHNNASNEPAVIDKSDMWLSTESKKSLNKTKPITKRRRSKLDPGENLQTKIMEARGRLAERNFQTITNPSSIVGPHKRLKPSDTVTSEPVDDVELPSDSQIVRSGLPVLNPVGLLVKHVKSGDVTGDITSRRTSVEDTMRSSKSGSENNRPALPTQQRVSRTSTSRPSVDRLSTDTVQSTKSSGDKQSTGSGTQSVPQTKARRSTKDHSSTDTAASTKSSSDKQPSVSGTQSEPRKTKAKRPAQDRSFTDTVSSGKSRSDKRPSMSGTQQLAQSTKAKRSTQDHSSAETTPVSKSGSNDKQRVPDTVTARLPTQAHSSTDTTSGSRSVGNIKWSVMSIPQRVTQTTMPIPPSLDHTSSTGSVKYRHTSAGSGWGVTDPRTGPTRAPKVNLMAKVPLQRSESRLAPQPSTSAVQEHVPDDIVDVKTELRRNDFLAVILKWAPNWFQERADMLKKLKTDRNMPPPPITLDFLGKKENVLYPLVERYNNFEEYSNKFMLPLLLHETWECCYRSWYERRVRGQAHNQKVFFSNMSQAGERLNEYTLYGIISERERWRGNCVGEGELVLLTLHGKLEFNTEKGTKSEMTNQLQLAFVEKVAFRETTVDNICACNADIAADRQQDSVCVKVVVRVRRRWFYPQEKVTGHIERIGSIVTTLRQFQCLAFMPKSPLCKHILYPTNSLTFCDRAPSSVPALLGEYNSSQSVAINTAAKMVTQPYALPRICLLQGPPGTGKSHTIIGIVNRIIKDSDYKARICLCAPSNAAVDELVRRLERQNKQDRKRGSHSVMKVIRLGKPSSIHPDVQSICLDKLVEKNVTQAMREELMQTLPQSLQGERRRLDKNINTMKKELSTATGFKVQKLQTDLKKLERDQEMLERKCNLDVSRMSKDPARRRRCEHDLICNSHVIAGTLSSIGARVLQNYFSRRGKENRRQQGFDCVIIDEATQAVELDTLIPLQYGSTKMILVGDPEQLPPTVISPVALENKLNLSLFERLDNHFRYSDRNPVILLDTQYRMDADICSFPNNYIYDGKLKTDESVLKRSNQMPLVPYLLYDLLDSQELLSQTSGSVSNQIEAEFIVRLCICITANSSVIPSVIGIIAPYNKQKALLKDMLKSRKLGEIEVSTVDGFQGREKHVIIVSCVRAKSSSGSIGFVGNRNRLNVSLTRAKYALYLVGCFASLSANDEWKAVITDGRQRNKIVRVDHSSVEQALLKCLKASNRNH